MPQSTRFCPLYADNKKIADLENVTFTLASGDEELIGTEGWIGSTDGAITCKAEANCIAPVSGFSVDLISPIINKRFVDIGFPIAGKILKFTGRVVTADMASDSKSGKATGKFSISGGLFKSIG